MHRSLVGKDSSSRCEGIEFANGLREVNEINLLLLAMSSQECGEGVDPESFL